MLSAREVEVLLLLDEHLGTDEIAQRLFISEHTVRSHVKSLLKKARRLVATRGARAARVGARGLAHALEPLEGGRHDRRQRLEVVTAFEHRRVRGASDAHRRASSRKPSAVTAISASGSSRCASNPAATITRSGSNARTAGSTTSLECRFVLAVARARSERDVDHPLPTRARPARSRPEGPLVQRHGEDARIVTEQRLGAVAVVHVEVDDRDPRGAELRLRVARRDGDVAEHAEAHRLGPAERDGPVGGRVRSRLSRRPGSHTLRRDMRPPTCCCWHTCPGRARPRRPVPRSSRRRRGRARARAAPASPGCRRHGWGSSRAGTAAGRGARDCRSSPGRAAWRSSGG